MIEAFIHVTLHYKGQLIDLKIPNLVTKKHLKLVVSEALKMMKMDVPSFFDLTILNKASGVGETDVLERYALGDGDQLALEVK